MSPRPEIGSPGRGQSASLLRTRGGALAGLAAATAAFAFVKELIIASRFGAGTALDAYLVAFTAVTFVPVTVGFVLQTTLPPWFFREVLSGRRRAKSAVTALPLVLGVGMIAFLAPLMMAAELWLAILGPGFDEERRRLSVELAAILLPLGVLQIANEVLRAVATTHRRFALPGASLALPPLTTMAAVLFFGDRGIAVVAIGWTLGTALQAVALISVCSHAHAFAPPSREGLLSLGALVRPGAPYVVVAAMPWVLVAVDQHFASQLSAGSISSLSYADKIFRLPLTIITTSLVTVAHPLLSEAVMTEAARFKSLLQTTTRAAVIVLMPVGTLMTVLALPLVGAVYERGRFDAAAVRSTAEIVAYLGPLVPVLGLWFAYDRGLAALGRIRFLAALAILVAMVKLALSGAFVGAFGLGGLPLATLAALSCAVVLMHVRLRADRVTRSREVGDVVLRAGAATAACALASLFVFGALSGLDGAAAAPIARVGAAGATGLAVYAVAIGFIGRLKPATALALVLDRWRLRAWR